MSILYHDTRIISLCYDCFAAMIQDAFIEMLKDIAQETGDNTIDWPTKQSKPIPSSHLSEWCS